MEVFSLNSENIYNGYYGAPMYYYKDMASLSFRYWCRSFFQRLSVLFDFEDLPENWDKDAFKAGLYGLGFLCGFYSNKYGLVIQPATVTGFGLQYQPTHAIINTPYFQFTEPLRIHDQCELIKLTPDYMGIWDLISKYASEVREIEIAYFSGLRAARFAHVAVATDDKSARTLKTINQKLINGEPFIVIDKEAAKFNPAEGDFRLPWVQNDTELAKNFIVPELDELRRNVIKNFYREIGINATEDKKERLITAEGETLKAESLNRKEVWRQSLDESLSIFNDHYGTNIKAVFTAETEAPTDQPKEGESNAN